MTLRSGLALCALLLMLSACDSGEESTMAENTFTLRVDGRAATRSQAYSGSFISDAETPAFAVLLGADPASDSPEGVGQPVLGFVRDGGRPAAGQYALASLTDLESESPSGTFIGVYIDPSQFTEPEEGEFDLGGFYFTTGGTLTITESSAGRMVGSFTATARQIDFMTGQFQGAPIQLDGEFNAVTSDRFQSGGFVGRRASVPHLPAF